MKIKITYAFSMLMAFAAGAAQEYYVHTESGSDSAAGTKAAPFKTIQMAMTTGRYLEADIVVHIASGVYEPAKIQYRGTPTYAVALVGEGTDENPVVIDGGGTNSCFRLENSNRRASFSNIVFRNGLYTKGGGICCVREWTTDNVSGVTNCVFVNCTATNGQGGAVFSSHLSSTFQSCVFSNCTSTAAGGAVALAEAHRRQRSKIQGSCRRRLFLEGFVSVPGCGAGILLDGDRA